MRDRFYGRIGNKSDNAFKLRKFAKMFDEHRTGYVRASALPLIIVPAAGAQHNYSATAVSQLWIRSLLCMQIGLEDFRVMTEAGGMQLDDDSLLALFSKVGLSFSVKSKPARACLDSNFSTSSLGTSGS